MKKLLLGIMAVTLLGVFTGCDDFAVVPLDDVIRYDFSITSDGERLVISDSVWNIYDTDELRDYQDDIDQVKELEITLIEGRLFNFREDHADNIVNGKMTFTTDKGDRYEAQMYEVGNEYKDGGYHEIYDLKFNGTDPGVGARDYEGMSEALLGSEILTISLAAAQVLPGPLDCDASVKLHYKGRAEIPKSEEKEGDK